MMQNKQTTEASQGSQDLVIPPPEALIRGGQPPMFTVALRPANLKGHVLTMLARGLAGRESERDKMGSALMGSVRISCF